MEKGRQKAEERETKAPTLTANLSKLRARGAAPGYADFLAARGNCITGFSRCF